MTVSYMEWISRFSDAAGVARPTDAEVEAMLTLAGVAARASERPAAPVTCWLAAMAGLSASDALSLAQSIADSETLTSPDS